MGRRHVSPDRPLILPSPPNTGERVLSGEPHMKKRTSSSISRRSFVKAASAALAAPMIIPSGVLGNASVPAANSRLGVGFIGMGKQVGGHVNGMLGSKGVQVLAVCDVYKPRREHFRNLIDEKHKEYERKDAKPCDVYSDYHELLARPDIDA